MTDKKRPAVFLDRDGTLNQEVNYLHRIEDFTWIPGAPEAVHRLNEAGFLVIVITNQAGIARGFYTEDDVKRLHEHMQRALAEVGAHIDAFYYSPYHPEGTVEPYRRDSSCRKPGTALFEEAAREWPVDLRKSFVVGDKESDIQAGQALGLPTILVETGYGATVRSTTRADYVDPDIDAAVSRIMRLCSTTP